MSEVGGRRRGEILWVRSSRLSEGGGLLKGRRIRMGMSLMTECLSCEAKSGCSPNFKWRCRFDGPRFGVLFPDKKYGTNIHVSVATGAYRVSGSDYRQF